MDRPPSPDDSGTMTVVAVRATLLTLPPEIRLRIYLYVFVNSILTICGYKFKRGHHHIDLSDRGKHISNRYTKFQLTHVCRQLRFDALPILMNVTTLACCHTGPRLVDTQLPLIYRNNIRQLSIDCESFNAKFINSPRLSLPYRRCKALPSLPQLQSLTIRTGACLQVRAGHKHNNLASTTQLKIEKTLSEDAIINVRKHLLDRSTVYLKTILANKDRDFSLYVSTLLVDITPKTPEGEIGAAVVSLVHSQIQRSRKRMMLT
jgi:hypothetical protein